MVRYEQVPNHGATNLDGAILDSDLSIDVIDGSVFPTAGDFRILIGTEVLLVTARSTDTLTVERGLDGTTAASASDGAAVKTVATADQWDRLAIDLGAGGRSDETNGGELPRLCQDQAGDLIVAADFSWANQQSATISDTDYGGLKLTTDAGGGTTTDQHVCFITLPATPWVATVKFFYNYGVTFNATWDWFGFLVRESSTGEFVQIRGTPWSTMPYQHMNSPTSNNTTIDNTTDMGSTHMWYRFADDGTNLSIQISTSGKPQSFYQINSESRTARLTSGADQIGFSINGEVSGGNAWSALITSFTIT